MCYVECQSILCTQKVTMRFSDSVVLLLAFQRVDASYGQRIWTDIVTYHQLTPLDVDIINMTLEKDPFFISEGPSKILQKSPSVSPSDFSSDLPSSHPSTSPSLSFSPSRRLTSAPSITPIIPRQSRIPTKKPTSSSPGKYPDINLPENVTATYFNYNQLLNAQYGPGYPELVRHNVTTMKIQYQNNGWTNVTNPEGADFYWSEFDDNGKGPWIGLLANRFLGKNQCDNVGKQSPIDVRDNGAECVEHHQIRNRVSSS